MKSISVRQFQQNMYKHLGELPLCITKHNKPAFYIVKEVPNQAETAINGEVDKKEPSDNISKASIEIMNQVESQS